MKPRGVSIGFIIIILFLTAGVGFFIASYRYTAHNGADERFLVYWAGMRNWLINGASPYSDSTASYIETLSVRSGASEARVTYPLYGGFLFLPFAAIPNYALARALWMTALGFALIINALLCLHLTGWRTSVWLMALFMFLAVTGYPSLSLLINGNATILAAMFLVASIDAIRLERNALAGMLLALSTVQPLVGIVALPFILLWSFARRRWLVVIWFFGLLVVLAIIGSFFIPTWILQWLRNLLHYSDYNAPASPGAAFRNWWPGIGRQAGLLFTLFLIISLFSEWWVALHREFRWFLWTTSMTIIVAQWVGIPAGVENFVALLLPMGLIASVLEERGGKKFRWVIAVILLMVYAGTWGLYFKVTEAQLRPALLFLPPMVLLLLTYYVRWWAIHPQRLLVDELRVE